MNQFIVNKIFFLLCFSLAFNNIPKILQMNMLGSVVGDKLVFYPLIAGLLYTIYCQIKYHNVFIDVKKFCIFLCVYLSINTLSVIHGAYIYPYYDLILNGPTDQIAKLPYVLHGLQWLGFSIEYKALLSIWLIIRIIKNIILESIYTFGGAYMIYCWYHRDWRQGFAILVKATMAVLCVISVYSVVEVWYLAGSPIAAHILTFITPFFHMIVTDHGWWPPLLWKGQLRSIFAEPSYLGTFAAFSLPFIWYKLLDSQKIAKKYVVLLVWFCFCLFLTKARTGVVLFICDCILLTIWLVYTHYIEWIRKGLLIGACSIIAFLSAITFITFGESQMRMTKNVNNKEIGISSYVNENIGSLASSDKRSNNARYSVMLADLTIGFQHPILGVGKEFRAPYVFDNLPAMGKDNQEINRWKSDMHELGVLKTGVPRLGEYTSRFAELGILGVFCFLFIPVYLMMKLFHTILFQKAGKKDKLIYALWGISFIGICIAAVGDDLNMRYCYWVLLGLGIAMFQSKKYSKIN